MVTPEMPIASWYITGLAAWIAADFVIGALWATYSCKKSYQRLNVVGSSESTWVPLVKVNHFRLVPVMCSARVGQCPPVCSSVHWQAMNTGTWILWTKVIGDSGSATFGL